MVPEEMSVTDDIDYINATYFIKYENVVYLKFAYKGIDYYVTYILNDSEVQQSRTIIRISSYTLKRQTNEEKVYSVEVTNVLNMKMIWITNCEYKDIDYDHVIKTGDIKVISDYSSIIVIGKRNISTSPVDIQIGEKEFEELEAEIGDDTCSFTITIWEDQTSPVDIQLGKKELYKKLEAEIEDQVKKFKNQLTYTMKIQHTKSLSLNSDVGESLSQENSSSATLEVASITSVGEISRFFRCKQCGEKVMPCQGNLQQCTVCRMTQLGDNEYTDISVILFLSEPELLLTIFQDQLDNVIKIYNEDNNENNRLTTLTDIALKKILLHVRNVKIHYDKKKEIYNRHPENVIVLDIIS